MTAKRIQKLSVEAYINLEESGQTKYEFHNGEVFALAGGSINIEVFLVFKSMF